MKGSKKRLAPGLFLLMSLLLMLLTSFVQAADYSLDYAQIGVAGSVCETTHYKVVDLVTNLGMSNEAQSGGIYTIIPTVGMDDGESSVDDWMLY